MSGIFPGDALIRTAIELGMDDMRKNPWLIEHMMSDFVDIRYIADKYGKKQVDACKEWFANNNVDVYMRGIRDKDRMPCITISVDNSNEKIDMKFMADQSPQTTILLPKQIDKTIPYIIPPFVPAGYDQDTGSVLVDSSVNLALVAPGMLLVNPANGQSFPILGIEADVILIQPDQSFEASQLGVLPQHLFFKARIEHTFFQETYSVGCHAHGDPQNAIWLHAIVLYSLLRYRESLLEANGFAESYVSNSPLVPNEHYSGPGGEEAWMRVITLNGQVENSWIKSPKRFIENTAVNMKILSNLNTTAAVTDVSAQTWETVADPDDEES
jgi:hypothetical protein